MTISARIIADSCQSLERPKRRLTTFVLKYPRFIHAELMTHRVFSRNASSSRAIPVKKMIEAVVNEPAMPVFWGKNQSGMQAAEELGSTSKEICQGLWLKARDRAVEHAESLVELGLHKQIANRILEPWMHIEVVLTSSMWANWYALRNHPMAQPEIRVLAESMLVAHRASTPQLLKPGEWHLPFVSQGEQGLMVRDTARVAERGGTPYKDLVQKVSAARCARVSYLKHDGTKASFDEEMALYERLMGGSPKHASPCEHQAMVPFAWDLDLKANQSNLKGWVQFRKTVPGEQTFEFEEFDA